MILSAPPATLWAVLALAAYLGALVPQAPERVWPVRALLLAWVLHGVTLLVAAGVVDGVEGWFIGFAPVLSLTCWLVLLVYGVESRLLPVAGARHTLALSGAFTVALAWLFPGEMRPVAHSSWAPLHWLLGLTSYGLFGVAVWHALMLDTTERRLRQRLPGGGTGSATFGLPLLRLERLTFRFVEAGFAVLTATLLLGALSGHWRWDHKTVLSLLGWLTFAHLVMGRIWRGWRGQRATRWIYAGALLLLLAYVGTRFVLDVLLHRTTA